MKASHVLFVLGIVSIGAAHSQPAVAEQKAWDAAFERGPETFEAALKEHLTDATMILSKNMALENVEPVRFTTKKLMCYSVVIRLQSGTTYSESATHGVRLNLAGWRNDIGHDQSGVGAVSYPLCAEKVMNVTIQHVPQVAGAQGVGPITVELWAKPTTQKAINARKRAAAAAQATAAAESKAVAQQICRECARETGTKKRKICLERRGFSFSDCGW